MDFCYFIGIDIAKDTLDWAVYTQQGVQLSTHTPNTLAGIKTALAEFKALPGWNPKQAVFCMEHTGIYNAHLLELLHQQNMSVWLESSLQIKQAGGMQRGKTDKVDARRIAQYAYRFRDQMRLWQPPREVIQKLAFLSSTRQRLNQAYNLLAVPVAEQETFISKSLQKTLKENRSADAVNKSLVALKEEQKAVEKAIKALLEADARLKELFDLMVSVPGIGPVIATELLIATVWAAPQQMQSINDPKKLTASAVRLPCRCCPLRQGRLCGTAPVRVSGRSAAAGKTKVSHQAASAVRPQTPEVVDSHGGAARAAPCRPSR